MMIRAFKELLDAACIGLSYPLTHHIIARAYRILCCIRSREKTNIYQTLDDVFAAPILETATHLTIHALFITTSQDTGTKEKIEELHNSSCSSGNICERCCGKNLLGTSHFSI
jgi:hypothetical protein